MTLEQYESAIRKKKFRKRHYPFTRFFSARMVIGAVILMNPIVGLIDIFPDFIGYMLINSALDELKRINDDIQVASLRMRYLIALGFARFIISFETFNLDNSWILTLVTLFGAFELFLIVLFFSSLFKGITYFQERHEGEGTFVSSSEISFLSIFFFVIKTLTTLLPQLWAIFEVQSMTELEEERALYSVLRMKPFAILLSVIICFIFGMIWVIKFSKYLRKLRKCDTMFGNLKNKFFSDILDRTTFFANKKVCFALLIISFGHLFLFDITMDHVHFMPEALFVIISAAGVLIIARIACSVNFWISSFLALASSLFMYYYRARYIDESVTRFTLLSAKGVIEAGAVYLLYAAAVTYFLISLQSVISKLGEKYFGEKITSDFIIPDAFFLTGLLVSGMCYACSPLRYYLVTVRIVLFAVWAYKSIRIFNDFSTLVKED